MTPRTSPARLTWPAPAGLRRALGLRFAACMLLVWAAASAHGQRRGAEQLNNLSRPAPSTTVTPQPSPTSTAPIQIRVGPYFGWKRSATLSNGTVEAIAVPTVGRVMQFRFVGQAGPFWEDTALRGKDPDPQSSEWGNFGGDKTWPSPQADWAKHTPRAWPPPPAFDSMPVELSIRRDTLVLSSPIDPYYGIRTERVIALQPDRPVMTITTTYEKVQGDPVTVGVWIITQLEEPTAVFAPIPARTQFEGGYNRQSGDTLPANLKVERGLLSLTRDPRKSTKIGMDAGRLLWVGPTQMLLIDAPRLLRGEYPDQGSSAEIYTNPDPKPYVELEMLGPMQTLKAGDRISQVNTYTLLPRASSDAETDARRVLGLAP